MTHQWAESELPGMPEPPTDEASQAGEWVELTRAAARLGVTERSVYRQIKTGVYTDDGGVKIPTAVVLAAARKP
jgi:hypothetical protein